MLDDPVQRALDDVAQVLGPIYVDEDEHGHPVYRSARLDALQTTVELLTEQVALLQGRLEFIAPLRAATATRRSLPSRVIPERGTLQALKAARAWDRIRFARARRRGTDLMPVLRPDLVLRLPREFDERSSNATLLPMPRLAAGVTQAFAVPIHEKGENRLLLLSSTTATAYSLASLAVAAFVDANGDDLATCEVLGVHASGDWELVEVKVPAKVLNRAERMTLTLTAAGAAAQLALLALVSPDGTRTPVSVIPA